MNIENFKADDIVKTCPKLESGLNLAINGLRACTRGALMPPLFCSSEDINNGIVTKDFIIEKRKEYIQMLNDNHTEMDCKRCLMVEEKPYGDISFSRLGHVDLQHYSMCNLRCTYCAYTRDDLHVKPQYDALSVLNLFSPEDVEWNAHVDFAGGEPTLLKNIREYLDFFSSRKIRVLMYTNSVKYDQAIYDGLVNGSIYMVTTSLDAGRPASYRQLRGFDYYLKVLENLTRYAAAGSNDKGMLSVKYIFCDSNCSDDDIAGFAYAMLAIRPQQVWLTFDFSPLFLQKWEYDYTEQIRAYAKLYLLLKKHGVEAFHYFEEAVAAFSRHGRDIMNRVHAEIEKQGAAIQITDKNLKLRNFRQQTDDLQVEIPKFTRNPLQIVEGMSKTEELSLSGKRVILVPACPQTYKLLEEDEFKKAAWIAFVDRNPIQQGKTIDGHMIYGYDDISSLNADIIITIPPVKHRKDILKTLAQKVPSGVLIAEPL